MTNFNLLLNTTKIVGIEEKLERIKEKIYSIKHNKKDPIKELEIEKVLYKISKSTNELEELINSMKGVK